MGAHGARGRPVARVTDPAIGMTGTGTLVHPYLMPPGEQCRLAAEIGVPGHEACHPAVRILEGREGALRKGGAVLQRADR